MKRSRFPRRSIRPLPGARSLVGRRPIPPKLREAHQAFELGEYPKAAELYLELAEEAHLRDIPQAPNLFLRGATALLKAGDADQALLALKRGLVILVERKKWIQLKRSTESTVERLRAEGQVELAARFRLG